MPYTELYPDISVRIDDGSDPKAATRDGIAAWRDTYGRIVPGLEQRFHKPVDPRTPPLKALAREAMAEETVSGRFADIGETMHSETGSRREIPIATNFDGATAVIFREPRFPPPLSRGLFRPRRPVGVFAHSRKRTRQGGHDREPIPKVPTTV